MATGYTIRRFRASDMDCLMELERASFGADAYDRKLFAEFSHKCGGLFLVVERGRNLCGYIVTCKRGDRAELVSIAVARQEQRRGAATVLLKSTLRRLRWRRVRALALTVRVTNRKARAFYEKSGFERTRIVRDYYGRGSDGIRMLKLL